MYFALFRPSYASILENTTYFFCLTVDTAGCFFLAAGDLLPST